MAKIKHGHNCRATGQTTTYRAWSAMLTRCTNRNTADWPAYGGRGIKVCERWRKFENFLVDMGVRPVGLSLDRKDNEGNYEKSNCRWATPTEQASNRRKRIKWILNPRNTAGRFVSKEKFHKIVDASRKRCKVSSNEGNLKVLLHFWGRTFRRKKLIPTAYRG